PHDHVAVQELPRGPITDDGSPPRARIDHALLSDDAERFTHGRLARIQLWREIVHIDARPGRPVPAHDAQPERLDECIVKIGHAATVSRRASISLILRTT